MCCRTGSTCIFEPSTYKRRKDALHHATKAANGYRKALVTIIKILKKGENMDVESLRKWTILINTIDFDGKDLQTVLDQCHYMGK